LYSIWFIDSVKGEEEGDGRGFVHILVHLVIQLSFIADFHWRLRFPLCDSCTITSVPCLMEMWKNGIWWMSCDQFWQWKMACHWDLVGVMGPWDPNASKQACRTVKKPVMNVDDLEDAGDRMFPSPATDLAASVFTLRNAANALVTESASIR
jgi:hypothetical protein